MNKSLISFLACSLVGSVALAQFEPDTDAFNGKWDVTIRSGAERPITAKVSLAGYDGVWQSVGKARSPKEKICVGKKFPITVQGARHSELEFTAWGSSVAPACPDIHVTLKPVNEKALEGTLDNGDAVRLTRR